MDSKIYDPLVKDGSLAIRTIDAMFMTILIYCLACSSVAASIYLREYEIAQSNEEKGSDMNK